MVGTILLLALTVTLFSSIFFFVNTFPRPPAQSANQFQASLAYSGNNILAIQILHLAGPSIAGNVLVYLRSSVHPSQYQNPYTVAQGLGGSNNWALGQTWNVTLAPIDPLPDNLTISIVATSQLLFQVVLPGHAPSFPPVFSSFGTVPANPSVGQGFEIYVVIQSKNLNTNSVYVNVSQLPGASGTLLTPRPMNSTSVPGQWVFSVPNGTTTQAGTFFIFVNATNQIGQTNSIVFAVVIGSGGGGGGSSLSVRPVTTPAAPAIGSTVTLAAVVTNFAASGGSLSVAFSVNGAATGSATGYLGAGSSGTFFSSLTWAPASVGTATVSATASVTGVGSATGSLNLTVFPKILLVAYNAKPGASATAWNESLLLAAELTSAGVPFDTTFVSCTTSISNGMWTGFGSYSVVIVDFGSLSTAGCTFSKATQTTIGNQITTNKISVWAVGTNGFDSGGGSTTCANSDTGFYATFGINTGGGNCATASGAAGPIAATYTAAPASFLLGTGVPALTLNNTTGSSPKNAFYPYSYFSNGVSGGHGWLKDPSNHQVGSWFTQGGANGARAVALTTEPALLTTAIPDASNDAWGAGAAGTDVVYNVMNYLCGLATSTSPQRALLDFAVSGAVLVGTNHLKVSTVYAGVRANGQTGGFVTATLYVNGAVALYQGRPVSVTVALSPFLPYASTNGFVALVWQAPSTGSYLLAVVLSSATGDYYSFNDQLNVSPLGVGIAFA